MLENITHNAWSRTLTSLLAWDKWPAPIVSFVQSFYCSTDFTFPMLSA